MTSDLIPRLCAILRGDSTDLPAGEDGERLLELARRHRVDRLVAHRLRHGPTVELRREVLVDELSLRELTRVLAALETVGATPLVFKGAALAHTHYPASWLRPRLDADILVAADRRRQAFEALRDLGYGQPPFVSGDLVMYQAPFMRTDDIGLVHAQDVHWRIANPQVIAQVLTHEELVARATTVSALGCPMRVPSAVDALVLACLHRAAHHNDAEDLLWLYDIHLIASRLNPDEGRRLVELASERSVKALCARGLRLSIEHFHTVVPADLIAQLTPGTGARREPSAVFLKKDLRAIDRLAADLRAVGPVAGARLVREHLFPPADYMGQAYGVRSRALLPAYYAMRVVTGVSKWFARTR
ncbi:MAG TPA: nucleotidyltransferase family protein [Vicinamibacterales bacterium]|nr:nucleotidyltransferase family protein [Vicinamibacterales bacterium]